MKENVDKTDTISKKLEVSSDGIIEESFSIVAKELYNESIEGKD